MIEFGSGRRSSIVTGMVSERLKATLLAGGLGFNSDE